MLPSCWREIDIISLGHNITMTSHMLPTDRLFNNLFMITTKKASKIHITGPLWRESTIDGSPIHKSIDVEIVSMPWCHHGILPLLSCSAFLYDWWLNSVLFINPLWSGDTIWRHRSGSTSAQVVPCCMVVPSHYLNQCWLIIIKVYWHSFGGNVPRHTSSICQ